MCVHVNVNVELSTERMCVQFMSASKKAKHSKLERNFELTKSASIRGQAERDRRGRIVVLL